MNTSLQSLPSRQRELKRLYKEQPPAMGVWSARSRATGRVFLAASMNVQGSINRARFELNQKRHSNAQLLQEWLQHGPDNFQFDVVDTLKRQDDPLYDYSDDLAALLVLWQEELQ